MQVISVLALQHPLAAVIHEVTLRYVGHMQETALPCFAVARGTHMSSMPFHYILSFTCQTKNWT